MKIGEQGRGRKGDQGVGNVEREEVCLSFFNFDMYRFLRIEELSSQCFVDFISKADILTDRIDYSLISPTLKDIPSEPPPRRSRYCSLQLQ